MQESKYPRDRGGFVALPYLWDSDDAAPLFTSENSARHFIRSRREQLVGAQAIAILCGRTRIHPERFAEVYFGGGHAIAARPMLSTEQGLTRV